MRNIAQWYGSGNEPVVVKDEEEVAVGSVGGVVISSCKCVLI